MVKSSNLKKTRSKVLKSNHFPFPPEAELGEMCQKLSDPNYSRVNLVLGENASPLERTKYEICQSIARYKREKKLSLEKLAQQIQLSPAETEEILFAHLHHFTLDRLFIYAEKLNIPLQIVDVSLISKNFRHKCPIHDQS